MEMGKFKVGDKVKRIANELDTMKIGEIHTVSYVCSGNIELDGISRVWFTENFELVNLIADAVKLLQDNGYSVMEPKPKRSGKVYISAGVNGGAPYSSMSKMTDNEYFHTIAIVDWTEGEGL